MIEPRNILLNNRRWTTISTRLTTNNASEQYRPRVRNPARLRPSSIRVSHCDRVSCCGEPKC
jgi:hypothetical protein